MTNFALMFFLVLLTTSALLSCNRRSSSAGASTTTETTPEQAVEPTNVKAIVTVGAGLNFNASTGSWSEMAINPITKAPEIIYYDRTAVVSPVAGALKYAAMSTAGGWNIQVIDSNSPVTASNNTCGGGATTASCIGAPNVAVPTASQPQIYDIKHFVSDGVATPVVAYAYGTGGTTSSMSGKMIRFAKQNTNGTWSIETAVSGAQILTATVGTVGPQLTTLEYPIKGVRLLVDDSNRAHLIFAVYAATANNSVYLYTMRQTDGTWLTPKVISTTAPSTLSFVSSAPTYAAGTGLTQTGATWCKYNTGGSSADATGIIISSATTDNAPTASVQPFILKCSAADADGSCATWQGLDLVTGCSGACITATPALTATNTNQGARSDIAVDPVTGKIFLSYYSAAPTLTSPAALATGLLSTVSPGACSDGLTSSAWATLRAHPSVAQGAMGLRVAADGSNFYLASLAAAAGTSITLSKISSALSTNWNTSPDQITVEATTNTVGGGFSYDSSTGALWGSYGALTATGAGASGQDIKVFGAYPEDISSSANSYINNLYVDQTNYVAQSTAVPMLDAAIAPNGNVGYVYFYQEPITATPGVHSHLYYGIRGGSVLSPVFGEKLVSNAIAGATTYMNGLHPALAFDKNSNPVISFLDQGAAANAGYLMVARSTNGGVSFDLDRVDGSAATTKNVGQYTSIDVSSSNTVGVSYYDFSTGATGQRLKFAKREKNGAWRRYIVDGPGSTGTGCDTTTSAGIGMYSNFKWTSTGRPVIVYQGAVAGVKSLKLAYATEAETSSTYTWKCLTIDNSLQGSNIRGAGIDLFLSSTDAPYIAHYDSTSAAIRVVTCPGTGSVLTCAETGASAFSGERLNYVLGSVTAIASRPGIRVTSTGKIWVSFHGQADQGLFIASNSTGAEGNWPASPETVESTPSGVVSTNTGQHGVLLLNSSEEPMLFYRSFENWIKYYSREPN